MRMFVLALLAVLVGNIPFRGQQPQGSQSRAPFVGCRSDGQLGPQPAPKSHSTPLLPSVIARRLVYYAASEGPGVLAPRGWHCFGVYGSNGSGLVVAPEQFSSRDFFGGHHFSTKGSAVELTYSYGGTSGRWAVADAIARYFPLHRNFIKDNFQGLDTGPLPSGPYPHDLLSQQTENLVRYTTPPFLKGAGTAWVLAPSARAIQGLTMLVDDTDGPNLLRVNVRLSDADDGLTNIILQSAQREAR